MSATSQSASLLLSQLPAMCALLSDSLGHVSFKAAILTSFRGLLRKAHITNSDGTLLREDVSFHPWTMSLRVRKSKTIQFAERSQDIPISRVSHPPPLCSQSPGDALLSTPHWPTGAGLPHPHHFQPRLLTAGIHKLLSCFEANCCLLGLDPDLFSSHSLRRG